MKKICIFLAIVLILPSSCQKEEALGAITLTTDSNLPYVLFYIAGTGAVTFIKGDGTREFHSLSPYVDEWYQEVVHINEENKYYRYVNRSNSMQEVITIEGKNITHFSSYYGLWSFDRIKDIDVSMASKLTYLNSSNANLQNLDVRKNPLLTYIDCSKNLLTNLDISKNSLLTILVCNNNLLTHLDANNNNAMEYLNIANNQFTASSLNSLFRTLPRNHSPNEKTRWIYISGNPGSSTCDTDIATKRGWTVMR